ncbi:hypothetical protein WA026_001427 [Henosepilachna vigintioctopunctata]|uniref:Leucine zipper homeobox-associated domain-containing protein n=1 Tax=Henosepilachna vigintioctopunctata TaxID=420089 RepID=A0AAW1UKJ0_9CUCU
MAGVLNCIVCKKMISKSEYKLRCAGECSGSYKCDAQSTEDESSQEDDVEVENMKKKVRQRKSMLQVENGQATKEMFKQLLGKIAGLDVIEEIRTAFDSLKKDNQILKRENDKLRMEVGKLKGEFRTIKNPQERRM